MSDDKRATWETYVSAWKAASADAKRAALSGSVDPACVYRDPLVCTEDREALVERSVIHCAIPVDAAAPARAG